MVSRKINELQLQREEPECQRLCALTLPRWQRRALLVPSAASHPTTATPPCPAPSPRHHGMGQFLGAEWPRTELHLDGTQVTAQQGVPHTCATFLPSSLAATPCRTRVETTPVSPPVPSFSPIPRGTDIASSSSFHQGVAAPEAIPCHPWQAGAPGHPQPVAPGCCLPWGHGQAVWAAGMERREEGAPAVAQASRELNMNSRAV